MSIPEFIITIRIQTKIFQNIFAKVRPDWNILEYYAVYDVQNTLSDDSSISNNPMTTYTDSPESIARKLDRSTFTKRKSNVVIDYLLNIRDKIKCT